MPNYPINNNVWYELNRELTRLMNIRQECIEQDFPLSKEEVINCSVPAWARENIKKLADHGVETINRTNKLYAFIDGGSLGSIGFTRPCVVGMTLPVNTYYLFQAQSSEFNFRNYWGGGPDGKDYFPATLKSRLPFDLSLLSSDQLLKFQNWVNAAVREKRIGRGVVRLFNEAQVHFPTLAHMDQRWPELKVLFQKLQEPWCSRARYLPTTRIKTAWKWPGFGTVADWRKENAKKMEVAGHVILAASVMDRPVDKKASGPRVTGSINRC